MNALYVDGIPILFAESGCGMCGNDRTFARIIPLLNAYGITSEVRPYVGASPMAKGSPLQTASLNKLAEVLDTLDVGLDALMAMVA